MDSNEQTHFDELICDSRFDDTVREDQQNALRVKIIQAFDESRRDMTSVEQAVIAEWNAKRVISIAAAVAVSSKTRRRGVGRRSDHRRNDSLRGRGRRAL